jgi:YVTN family beta-propeller protein
VPSSPLAYLAVSFPRSGEVRLFSESGKELRRVAVDGSPYRLAVRTDGALGVAAQTNAHVIDPCDGSVTTLGSDLTFAFGVAPRGEDSWLVSDITANVVREFSASGRAQTHQVGEKPEMVVTEGARTWIATTKADRVVAYDLPWEQALSVEVKCPMGLVQGPKDGVLASSCEDGVTSIGPNGAIRWRVDVRGLPTNIWVDGSAKKAWATSRGSGEVAVIDLASRNVTYVAVGGRPWGIAPLGPGHIAVTNSTSRVIHVLDRDSGAITAEWSVDAMPWDVAAGQTACMGGGPTQQ